MEHECNTLISDVFYEVHGNTYALGSSCMSEASGQVVIYSGSITEFAAFTLPDIWPKSKVCTMHEVCSSLLYLGPYHGRRKGGSLSEGKDALYFVHLPIVMSDGVSTGYVFDCNAKSEHVVLIPYVFYSLGAMSRFTKL